MIRDRQVDITKHSLSLRGNIITTCRTPWYGFRDGSNEIGKIHGTHVRRLSTWIERHVHSVDKVHTCQAPRYVFSRRVERECLAVSDWSESQQGLLSWLIISSQFPWLRFRLIGSDDCDNLVHPLMRVTNKRWRGIWLPFGIESYFRRSPTLNLTLHHVHIQDTVQKTRCVKTSGRRNNTNYTWLQGRQIRGDVSIHSFWPVKKRSNNLILRSSSQFTTWIVFALWIQMLDWEVSRHKRTSQVGRSWHAPQWCTNHALYNNKWHVKFLTLLLILHAILRDKLIVTNNPPFTSHWVTSIGCSHWQHDIRAHPSAMSTMLSSMVVRITGAMKIAKLHVSDIRIAGMFPMIFASFGPMLWW